jgi:hypothetical protein
MGFFNNILSKLGFGEGDKAAPAVVQDAPAAAVLTAAVDAPAPTPLKAIPVSVVDVVGQLEAKAAASKEKLNWKTSIVDLLKLLGLDSSLAARKELATELGCPADKMGDSAQMNMWLHKAVLQKLAANGGNVPADLL